MNWARTRNWFAAVEANGVLLESSAQTNDPLFRAWALLPAAIEYVPLAMVENPIAVASGAVAWEYPPEAKESLADEITLSPIATEPGPLEVGFQPMATEPLAVALAACPKATS